MSDVEKYPVSYLWTMVADLCNELGLHDAQIGTVKDFGYLKDEGDWGAVFVEVFTHAKGVKSGYVRHTRFIERDVSYPDWQKATLREN